MSSPRRICLPVAPDEEIEVRFEGDGDGALADTVHRFGEFEINAINAAIAAGRPLLVRGEPGIGKSQLARAAAKELDRAYIPYVIDSHTESRDLLWHFDAVRRLADAQIAGALGGRTEADLAERNYLNPGPLWWAFDWEGALAQAESRKLPQPPQPPQRDGGKWENGSVVLIDEIDKAELEVPNGLLEALGAREFTPFGWDRPIRTRGPAPLIVITSNDERALPDAFLRRCLVLNLSLPKDDEKLIGLLVKRGKAHFPEASDSFLLEAAQLLARDRRSAINARIRPHPGQAEYLDLLRAVLDLTADNKDRPVDKKRRTVQNKPTEKDEQTKMIEIVSRYTLKKHMGLDGPI